MTTTTLAITMSLLVVPMAANAAPAHRLKAGISVGPGYCTMWETREMGDYSATPRHHGPLFSCNVELGLRLHRTLEPVVAFMPGVVASASDTTPRGWIPAYAAGLRLNLPGPRQRVAIGLFGGLSHWCDFVHDTDADRNLGFGAEFSARFTVRGPMVVELATVVLCPKVCVEVPTTGAWPTDGDGNPVVPPASAFQTTTSSRRIAVVGVVCRVGLRTR